MEAQEKTGIIEKIAKLLALSNDKATTDAEAQTALLMAQKLMAKHSIEMAEVGEAAPKELTIYRTNIKDCNVAWVHRLMSIIGQNYRCQNYFIGGYTVFMGVNEDPEIAAAAFVYAYNYAMKQAKRRYRQSLERRGSGAGVMNSYLHGFNRGLNTKFEEQRDELLRGQMALVLVMDNMVVEKYDTMFPEDQREKNEQKTRNASRIVNSQEHYNAGFRDGHALQDKHTAIEG